MAARLRSVDFQRVLAFVGDARTVARPEPFPTELLDELTELLGCDFATYSDLDLLQRIVHAEVNCTAEGPPRPKTDADWVELEEYGPHVPPSGIGLWSDIWDAEARRSSEPLCRAAGESGIVDALCMHFNGAGFERTGIYTHKREGDFTERDRLIAETLKPHVAFLHHHARARRQLRELVNAFEHGDEDGSRGIVLLGSRGTVEYASPTASRLVGRWFGEHNGRLPSELEDWRRSSPLPAPLERERGGRRLAVEAASRAGMILTETVAPPVALTRREVEVLRCVAAGKSTAETARLLTVTRATVSKHLENVYGKLGVHSRTAAVARLSAYLN